METKGYFHTKAGRLTLAFLVIIFSSVLIMAGLYMEIDALAAVGFLLILAAMLYSPCRIYLFRKK